MVRERRNLKVKPRLLFLVEGETEKVFFDTLAQEYRLTAARSIKVLGSSGKDWIEKAQNILLKNKDFKPDNQSRVFIIFDHDDLKETDIEHMINFNGTSIGGAKVEIGFSNKSFEVWILAHYEKMSDTIVSNKTILKKLEEYLGTPYIKADSKQMKLIVSDNKVLNAIENVSSISGFSYENQATNIGIIVDSVLKK